MEYKRNDTVKLLKDCPVPDSDKIIGKGELARVFEEGYLNIRLCFEATGCIFAVKKEDIKFIERVIEKEGKCPLCGSENLDYETCIVDGEHLYYPWSCEDCDAYGEEWYKITYTNTIATGIYDS